MIRGQRLRRQREKMRKDSSEGIREGLTIEREEEKRGYIKLQ